MRFLGEIVSLRLLKIVGRLVGDLGLKSTLLQYNVPRDDFPQIARLAVGEGNDPLINDAIELLDGIYQ